MWEVQFDHFWWKIFKLWPQIRIIHPKKSPWAEFHWNTSIFFKNRFSRLEVRFHPLPVKILKIGLQIRVLRPKNYPWTEFHWKTSNFQKWHFRCWRSKFTTFWWKFSKTDPGFELHEPKNPCNQNFNQIGETFFIRPIPLKR